MKIISALLFAVALTVLAMPSSYAAPHVGDCTTREGVEKARCERHTRMAEKCGPLKGEAHFVCDREFLLANPLDCNALTGKAKTSCEAEIKAFKTCEKNEGREFMRCVRTTTGESPMGH